MADSIGSFPFWSGFLIVVLLLLSLDLGLFHRKAHSVGMREALLWTIAWVSLSLMFGAYLYMHRGNQKGLEFFTGYLIEYALSVDNVFVFIVLFNYFAVPARLHHRVLFWGILGALIMRGFMIGLGAALIQTFRWIPYFFGAFLVVTGIKMLFSHQEEVHPEKNPLIRLACRFFPVSPKLDGNKFWTRIDGRTALTPLALVLLMVETTDLIFAVDSIPAIFAVTQKTFIVFTSNIFAILGLRSLYFVLANAIGCFHYLKYGLSSVLVFIGIRMVLDPHSAKAAAGTEMAERHWFQVEIPTTISLLVVLSLILVSIAASLLTARKKA